MQKIGILPAVSLFIFSKILYAATPIYTEQQTTILITPNQPQFIIQLKSNPATGYTWSLLSYDKKLIKVIKHVYVSSATKLMGAPGVEQWTFKLTAAGIATAKNSAVEFVYVRPWEPHVQVKPLVFTVTSQTQL